MPHPCCGPFLFSSLFFRFFFSVSLCLCGLFSARNTLRPCYNARGLHREGSRYAATD